MKKYKIKYQDKSEIKELILETKNLSNEPLPSNIIEIKEFKKHFDFGFFRKKRLDDKKLNLLFYELNIMLQANINISDELNISINTVKTHIKHIYEKLNVKDRLSFAGLFSK